ncbi:hypothetical protein CDAR_294731 [Caerostris darwini]|uniref:Uncharacterized protein n=1 Tax=Caerostris darwini TaxID=1538125 RepID=A0AAV4UKD3_9ARAC|nr:hypothetical protein CDAR_294731 [Caerostris darwini]
MAIRRWDMSYSTINSSVLAERGDSDHHTGEPSISERRRVEKKLSGTRFPQSANDKGNVWGNVWYCKEPRQHSFVFQVNPNIPIMSVTHEATPISEGDHARTFWSAVRRCQKIFIAKPQQRRLHKTDPPSCERCFMDNDKETERVSVFSNTKNPSSERAYGGRDDPRPGEAASLFRDTRAVRDLKNLSKKYS